jgi:hypothetical protein
MATQQVVNVGTQANDATGDLLRDAFTKINNNFAVFFTGNFPTAQMTVGPPPSGVALTVNGIAGQSALTTSIGTVSIGAPTNGTQSAFTVNGSTATAAAVAAMTINQNGSTNGAGGLLVTSNTAFDTNIAVVNTANGATNFSDIVIFGGSATDNAALIMTNPNTGANSHATGMAAGQSFSIVTENGNSGVGGWPIYFATGGVVRMTIGGAGQMGFFGGSAVAKPTVSGSKGGNAALTSLMNALAALGLVTDTTT